MDCTKKRPNDNVIPFVCEAIFPLVIAIAKTGDYERLLTS